jgi:hypothetical protein
MFCLTFRLFPKFVASAWDKIATMQMKSLNVIIVVSLFMKAVMVFFVEAKWTQQAFQATDPRLLRSPGFVMLVGQVQVLNIFCEDSTEFYIFVFYLLKKG